MVFHQAAQPGVRHSWGADFGLYVRHNIIATQRLLEACARVGVPHLVAASSSSVYGDAPTYPTTESSATRPVSPYGVTKLASEHLCLAYAQPAVCDLTVTTLRYFTVYGPRQRPDMGFRRFLEAAYAGGADHRLRRRPADPRLHPRRRRGQGQPAGDGRASRRGGQRRGWPPGRPSTRSSTWSGAPPAGACGSVDEPAQAGDARHTGADGTRAEALLGYRPEVDLADGIAGQAAWIARRQRSATRTGV